VRRSSRASTPPSARRRRGGDINTAAVANAVASANLALETSLTSALAFGDLTTVSAADRTALAEFIALVSIGFHADFDGSWFSL